MGEMHAPLIDHLFAINRTPAKYQTSQDRPFHPVNNSKEFIDSISLIRDR